MNLGVIENAIGYTFRDPSLFEAAMIHASVAGEYAGRTNERMEFLGDAILELCVSERLYHSFPDMDEGVMTRRRAALVCEESLCACARAIGLGQYIRMSRGEDQLGGRDKPAVLSDAFEALLAAVYLDGGKDAVMAICIQLLDPDKPSAAVRDYKTRLQEHLQKTGIETPEYRVAQRSGPPHAPFFKVEAYYGGTRLSCGSGGSKKAAEQDAARAALETLHAL